MISTAEVKTFECWRTKQGPFVHRSHVFQMGLIFNFDNAKKMEPGAEITFGSLNFVVYQLGNLHL
jgi:hypothetical protein